MKCRCMLYLDEEIIRCLKQNAIMRKSSMSNIIENLVKKNLLENA